MITDIKEMFFASVITGAFCFLVFTIKSCSIESDKLALERLKIPHKIERTPHKIERTHKATVESSGAQPQVQ